MFRDAQQVKFVSVSSSFAKTERIVAAITKWCCEIKTMWITLSFQYLLLSVVECGKLHFISSASDF